VGIPAILLNSKIIEVTPKAGIEVMFFALVAGC